ncbi:MAG: ComF family protein [Planctomycetaceae bacterium]|nr:ComF family protein [Planctomycetaceae bacterium]
MSGGRFPRLRDLARCFFHFLIPERCAYCGQLRNFISEREIQWTPRGHHFHAEWSLCADCQDVFSIGPVSACRRCGSFVKQHEFSMNGCQRCCRREFWFDRVIALGKYQGNLRQAIFMMKKRLGNPLTRTMGQICCEQRYFQLTSVQSDVVLPVPMHPFFQWMRGTNDAQLLAAEIGKRLGVPVNERIVRCCRLSLSQRAVKMRDRAKNVRGIFAPYHKIPDKTRWLGKRALVVDDVMTTGATINELSRILKTELGFADVTVVVIARARGNVVPETDAYQVLLPRKLNSYEKIWEERWKKYGKKTKLKPRKFNVKRRNLKKKPKSSK